MVSSGSINNLQIWFLFKHFMQLYNIVQQVLNEVQKLILSEF